MNRNQKLIRKKRKRNSTVLFLLLYFVLTSTLLPAENSIIRDVNEYNSKWGFGGGTDYIGDPNVIDILGDNSNLGNYTSEPGATVYPFIDLIKVE